MLTIHFILPFFKAKNSKILCKKLTTIVKVNKYGFPSNNISFISFNESLIIDCKYNY
jgi:hypothetical protein